MPKSPALIIDTECIICGDMFPRKESVSRHAKKKTCGKHECTSRLALKTTTYILDCVGCGNKFSNRRQNAKYCSTECQTYRYKKVCVICETEFPSKKANTQTCSHKCRWELNRSLVVELECLNCGIEFERPSFTVSGENNFCSQSCNNIFFAVENYGSTNRYGNEWHHIRKEVLMLYNYECQRCGLVDNVSMHVHHVIPRKYYADKSKANNIELLIPLCECCHKTIHKENAEWYDETFGQREDIV
jgi:hypothetical protein